MSPLLLAAFLGLLATLAALCLLKGNAWLTTLLAVIGTVVALVLIHLAASTPLPGPPPSPFVLWAEHGDYSWVSPDRDAPPRTYDWLMPDDMRRDLRKGTPLLVEREGVGGKKKRSGDDTPGEYTWTPLEPEGAKKEQQ